MYNVLATSLGTFHEWLPRLKHCEDLEPNGLKKKKHALRRAETSTESNFLKKDPPIEEADIREIHVNLK